MSNENAEIQELSEANELISALMGLDLKILSLDARKSFRSSLEHCQEILKPYNEGVEAAKQEKERRQAELDAICEKEGHVGKWKEGKKYVYANPYRRGNWDEPMIEVPCWTMYCKRCYREIETLCKPKEVKIAELQAQLEELTRKRDNL